MLWQPMNYLVKWAVVSIKRGAASAVKDVKESLEYIESFDNIVICFDKDKAGQEAAQKVATIIKPGKAKIVTLPNGYKDPNDMLKQEALMSLQGHGGMQRYIHQAVSFKYLIRKTHI